MEMQRKRQIILLLLLGIVYGGCGGTAVSVETDIEDSEMTTLANEQEALDRQVAQSAMRIDLNKLNAVQEKLTEGRK